MSSASSETPLPRLRLAKVSNTESDWIEAQYRLRGFNPNQCPTCESYKESLGGQLVWPEDPVYRYQGKEYVCDCLEQDKLRRHYMLAMIPDRYWQLGPEEWYGDGGAWQAMEDYLAAWEGNRRFGLGLEFYSPTMGTGKTFLATFMARELVKRAERVIFMPFRKMVEVYDLPYEKRAPLEERLQYSRVMILDEVGRGLSPAQEAFFADKFEDLIRTRIDENRVTITTTNLTPRELDDHYPRCFGLLEAVQTRYKMRGDDERRKGKVRLKDMELVANDERRPIL